MVVTIGNSKGQSVASNAMASLVEVETEPLSLEYVCLQAPLYHRIKVTNRNFLRQLRVPNFQFDAHCIHCGKESTFKTMRSYGSGTGQPVNPDWMLENGKFAAVLNCQRVESHQYFFIFDYTNLHLTKYGQLPSLEDIVGGDIKKFANVLPKKELQELKRATGLASHGIGIGAFVYLRRIFEGLIKRHYNEFISANGEISGFNAMRMNEKIAALNSVLPNALVQNSLAYGILSAGIHELDEDTCRDYFPIVREAIIVILEQDLQKRQQADAEKKLQSEIAAVAAKVKANK